jgi:hypothetical protein
VSMPCVSTIPECFRSMSMLGASVISKPPNKNSPGSKN